MSNIQVKQHYGWVNTQSKSPYEHIRETHLFLTDTNHSWEDTGHSIIILRNSNSPDFHPLTPEYAKTNFWFSLEYKIYV